MLFAEYDIELDDSGASFLSAAILKIELPMNAINLFSADPR